MNTIEELERHELTAFSKLADNARAIMNRDIGERDAVEIALANATNIYDAKTAELIENNKSKRFVDNYGGKDFTTVGELYDSAYTNAADTCADYGIDPVRDYVFYKYAFASMTHSQLEMDVDQYLMR